jgi:hypothetical protein
MDAKKRRERPVQHVERCYPEYIDAAPEGKRIVVLSIYYPCIQQRTAIAGRAAGGYSIDEGRSIGDDNFQF